jgi:hypothetical protein
MPEAITLYRVFVSTPGDIAQEHLLIDEVLDDWNRQHGPKEKVRIESIRWSTHTYPAVGERPQDLINKQAFDRADLVVALFWTKFGSPTGKYDSGTEEEIDRGIRMKKPVMVYFSSIPAPDGKVVPKQQAKITAFKKRFGRNAMYHTYTDVHSFQRAFRQHLALAMMELLQHNPSHEQPE